MTDQQTLPITATAAERPRFEFFEELHEYRVDGVLVPSVTQALKETGMIDYSMIPQDVLQSAAKRGTATIPIVMLAGDPVGTGLVASLGRPGGNVTGLTNEAGLELAGKRLELLKDAAPKTSRVGILWDSSNPAELRGRDATLAPARVLGLTLLPQDVRTPKDLEGALAALSRARADALMVLENSGNIEQRKLIVSFAERHRMPTVFGERASVEDGGLMSYGTDFVDLLRRAATYIDKILKGAKPADLPVEQPTKFELVINRKTAKALGLTIPPSVLGRADEVIE